MDYYADMGNQDDVYDITITPVENCTPEGNGIFDLATPMAGVRCSDILYSTWKECEPSFPGCFKSDHESHNPFRQ